MFDLDAGDELGVLVHQECREAGCVTLGCGPLRVVVRPAQVPLFERRELSLGQIVLGCLAAAVAVWVCLLLAGKVFGGYLNAPYENATKLDTEITRQIQ